MNASRHGRCRVEDATAPLLLASSWPPLLPVEHGMLLAMPTPGLLLLQLLVSLLVRSLALEQHSSCRWVSILAGLFDVACLPVQVCQQLDEHVYMRVSN